LTSDLPGLKAGETAVAIDGQVYEDASRYPTAHRASIAPRFFETFDRTLLAGRDFGSADDAEAPPVAIVNASFAERFMTGVDPVGRRIRLGRDSGAPWLTVVGVAPDLYMDGAQNEEPAGVYVPLAQAAPRAIGVALPADVLLAVRAYDAPLSLTSAIRRQVTAIDRDLPVFAPRTLRQRVDESVWPWRVFGPLLVVVGAAALFLATIGLYSLMAFAMRQRTWEIGLRMALGARPAHVARLITAQVGMEIAIGLLGGAALATVLARSMRAMLFHVRPDDPLTYVAIVAALVSGAVLAAWVPVRRAIRVDPAVTMRNT
jgi:hypothetical protein